MYLPYFIGMRGLDLSKNLIPSWDVVAQVTSELPHLRALALKYAVRSLDLFLKLTTVRQPEPPETRDQPSPCRVCFSEPTRAPAQRDADHMGGYAARDKRHASPRDC